jgi:hypothetical protein
LIVLAAEENMRFVAGKNAAQVRLVAQIHRCQKIRTSPRLSKLSGAKYLIVIAIRVIILPNRDVREADPRSTPLRPPNVCRGLVD